MIMPTIIKHYVPILKWKRGEQNALKALKDKERESITPLIELVMPTVPLSKTVDGKIVKKSPEEISAEIVHKFEENRIKEIPEEILQSWGDKPVFLDFTLLHGRPQLKIDSLNYLVPAGENKRLKITPVLNLNDDSEIKKAVVSLHPGQTIDEQV